MQTVHFPQNGYLQVLGAFVICSGHSELLKCCREQHLLNSAMGLPPFLQ
jgi:hypothetical protein